MKIFFFLAVCFCFLLFSCGGSSYIEVSKLPDTYQCTHMEEICKEAREFESKYSQMSDEEKKEFKTLRDTYRDQCNTALEQCKKSAP